MRTWTHSPVRWLAGFLWRSFWGLPIVMLTATMGLVALLLRADGAGASIWVRDLGWPFTLPGATAQELASTLVGVETAFASLYFSITLVVLTLAAGSVGVRLVDRWISRLVTRITLGLLLSALAWSLILVQAIDPDKDGAEVARLTLTTLSFGTIVLLGWLAYALHDLGRTIHIDTAIAHLRETAIDEAEDFDRRVEGPRDVDWSRGTPIIATRNGYLESIGFEALARMAGEAGGHVRVSARVGDFIVAGEPLGRFVAADTAKTEGMPRHFSMGGFRSSSEGAAFQVRLTVEIAARALSPAINDFYTALACVDALGPMMIAHGKLPQASPWLADDKGVARVFVDLSPFDDLFNAPLKALRQAAADYPSVSIHLILMLRRVRLQLDDPDIAGLLDAHIAAIAEHAAARTQFADDARAIRDATGDDLARYASQPNPI